MLTVIGDKEVTVGPPYVNGDRVRDYFDCGLCGHNVEALFDVHFDPTHFSLETPARVVACCAPCVKRWAIGIDYDLLQVWWLENRDA